MFLKRLTIKGFKSFADQAVLDVEPGITVVVGPNGSGKSNVVDAVTWVLGAQAPSAVRSQKMDDVIFAGTAERPALDRAEVSLTIDNEIRLLPVDLAEITITRTLLRTGESEYSLNGASCRLLDIQELLSDASVGRQQHVIISQGQIDAVLNAHAEERRMIIEDAAGILKYRKRREKAERRLRSTEVDLDRLGDLQREVRRQLRPLEHQAEAARRHGDLVGELSSLRRHHKATELATLRGRAREEAALRAELAGIESGSRTTLEGFADQITSAEAELAAGGDDLGDRLLRYESLRERGRGIRGVLVERLRGIERDREAFVSQQMVLGLEADKTRAEAELAGLESESESLAPESERLALAETGLAADRAAFEVTWAEGVVSLGTHAAEARGELGVLRATLAQASTESDGLAGRLALLEAETGRLDAAAADLRHQLSEGETAEQPLVEALTQIEQRLHAAAMQRNAVWERLATAEADVRTVRARAEALALALDEARSRAGVAHLSGIEGVLGTLLDLVEVDEGYEAAFAAAAGEALDAVVVEDVERAVQALDALREGRLHAAVLSLVAGAGRTTVPPVGRSVREHVRARTPEVDRLLDRLLAPAAIVDANAAVEAAMAHPDAVFVTLEGDRFGPSGWRIGGDRGGATGAALAEAESSLTVAEDERADARRQLDEAERQTSDLEDEVVRHTRQLDVHDGRFTAAAEALQRLQAERRDVVNEAEGLRTRIGVLEARLRDERSRVADLETRLPDLEDAESEAMESGRRMAEQRRDLEERSAELSGRRTAHEVRVADLTARRNLLLARVTEYSSRLDELNDERQQADQRRSELDLQAAATRHLVEALDVRMSVADGRLDELREQRRRQSERVRAVAARLDGLRRERSDAERSLADARERLNRLEVDRAETRLRLENLTESIHSEFGCEPDAIMDAPGPDLPDGVTATVRITELERELELMGPVNPLALEEYDTLRERHEFLVSQLEDIRNTRRDLRKVIRSIDDEIASVFAEAFAEVSTYFTDLFDTLFPGGTGRLHLTDPDNLLETGIEVEAKPSGKNVRKLSLLSGGERSLTALAFLFAVFRSRPSPFYVMDEVEAALDDVNLHRFLGLVRQFRNDAQLLIVSHQKRTMEAADCLFGVTMAPGGSSRVVSERVAVDRVAEDVVALVAS
ncbi:MAG: chromosome segregation protein SMC [Acidimicrobiales bacterium]|nr:chromosome segregation protein SMC [Acidimicrobiales bacterium]MDP6649448.1 chromosome segregation protein SMC [Acidimicrobiales bacterium]MDP6760157.1 chromosome segregation protein SMC [Acidimicrobiales bacterium]